MKKFIYVLISLMLLMSGCGTLEISFDVTPASAAGAVRMVGQSHGHNFLPCFGEKECDQCEAQQRCAATSVFVSENDLLWSRCVFSRQPWAFCQIFGLDARGTPVQQMYGFRRGRLVERGFYVLP